MNAKSCFAALAVITFGAGAWAQTATDSISQTDNIYIPNDDLSGVAETISLGSDIVSVTGVQLTLDIGGTANYEPFNGNYYAYLEHGTGFAVLLNRVGVTAVNPFGYSDMGFDVTFSDSAPDIHNYQTDPYTLNGNGQLTGTWGPDGEMTSPLTVVGTSPQTALLSSFDGENAGGNWTLFIADTSPGDPGNLVSWSLQVTGDTNTVPTVPDSCLTMGLLAVGFSLLLLLAIPRPSLAAATSRKADLFRSSQIQTKRN